MRGWSRPLFGALLVGTSCLGSNPETGEAGAELLEHADLGRTRVDPQVRGIINLTFDDGPVPETRQVVDILDKHHAYGGFFMVGRRIPGNRDVVEYVRSHGHQVANHTYNHEIQPTLTESQFKDRVRAVKASIGDADDGRLFFRFPYGSADQLQLDWLYEVRIDGHRYRHVGWHMDSQDFDFNRSYPAEMYSKQVAAEDEGCGDQPNPFTRDFIGWSVFTARQTGGGIMLFHDIAKITHDHLDEILTYFDDPDRYWASLPADKAETYRKYYACRKANPNLRFVYGHFFDGTYPSLVDGNEEAYAPGAYGDAGAASDAGAAGTASDAGATGDAAPH